MLTEVKNADNIPCIEKENSVLNGHLTSVQRGIRRRKPFHFLELNEDPGDSFSSG